MRHPLRGPIRFATIVAATVATMVIAGCYPRYDWRDLRPDCAKGWCEFVASFPGKVASATRDVPVDGTPLPLTLHVVSVGTVTFAVGAFDLRPGSDVAAARATFERKLLDDVGATDARRGRATIRTANRSELAADTFEADGRRGDQALRVSARFVEHRRRLVEILVIGPADVLSTDNGRQAIETFVTSVRLD